MNKKCWFAIVTLLVTFSTLAHAAGALDGMTFTVKIGKGNNTQIGAQDDELIFEGGKMSSTLCNKFGYKPGDYKAVKNGGLLELSAETASDQGGKKIWHGSVNEGVIDGHVTTIENNATEEGWFSGNLKPVEVIEEAAPPKEEIAVAPPLPPAPVAEKTKKTLAPAAEKATKKPAQAKKNA